MYGFMNWNLLMYSKKNKINNKAHMKAVIIFDLKNQYFSDYKNDLLNENY